jgi:hypothetical protein
MLPGRMGIASVQGQLVGHGQRQRAGWVYAFPPLIRPWCWRGLLGGCALGQAWRTWHWCGCCLHCTRVCGSNANSCNVSTGSVGAGEPAFCSLVAAQVVDSQFRPRRTPHCIVTNHGDCWDRATVAPRSWSGGVAAGETCSIVASCRLGLEVSRLLSPVTWQTLE